MSDKDNEENITNEEDPRRSSAGGLVVEPKEGKDQDQFNAELNRTLEETERQISTRMGGRPDALQAWQKARQVVEQFKPVPWFIWRLSNFVFSRPGQINVVPQGMVMGLRRLLFAAASDEILGSGTPVNNMRIALSALRSDIIAAVSVIHGVCRKLSSKDFERIWRPILEDAILRAQIGFFVGERRPGFGSGRGMLAGFSGRAGLAVLIASGDIEQARKALEELASGRDIGEVGLEIYGCDPLQISAMMLSAAGCGRDAAFGTVSFAAKDSLSAVENEEQQVWLAAFTICEKVRLGRSADLDDRLWNTLGYNDQQERDQLADMAKILVRNGTAWNWLV